MTHGKSVLTELSPLHRRLRKAVPDVYRGFGELHSAAFADGDAAVRAGATRQQAAEAIGVTFLMKGRPATIHGPRAYDAFCEFADAHDAGEQPA